MPHGKLEVLLVSAKGLEGFDFLSNIDPYAILTCRTQEQKSSVAIDAGSNPEWNQYFIFTISGSVSELVIKLYDKDIFTADDYLGKAEIPLEAVILEGSLPIAAYNVVKDGEYCGEVRLGLTFIPEGDSVTDQDYELPGEEIGGWKESSYD
ncbi:hypothetical protein V2J09_024283 [Rumex salicifolius]